MTCSARKERGRKTKQKTTHNDELCQKDTRVQLKKFQMANLSKKIKYYWIIIQIIK